MYERAAFFQVQALVLDAPRTSLEYFLDVPATRVGDLFFIQNLTALLMREGTFSGLDTSWVDAGGAAADSLELEGPDAGSMNAELEDPAILDPADAGADPNNSASELPEPQE
jgi:hypothetical protein